MGECFTSSRQWTFSRIRRRPTSTRTRHWQLFRGLFSSIWPAVKKVGLEVGKEALRTGSGVASDYLKQVADPKQALKRRARQAAGRTLTKFGQHLAQEGKGLGSRPPQKSIEEIRCRGRVKRRKLEI